MVDLFRSWSSKSRQNKQNGLCSADSKAGARYEIATEGGIFDVIKALSLHSHSSGALQHGIDSFFNY